MLLQLQTPAPKLSAPLLASRKAALGQFMTPLRVARFMASLFSSNATETCRLLDAGAGQGALSCAFLDRWKEGGLAFERVETSAYEIDPKMCVRLQTNLGHYTGHPGMQTQVIAGEFIDHAVRLICLGKRPFTHAILNPPYKKIGSHSPHRLALRHVGIETVNLYSGFVALAVALLAPKGQLVAIIPRSFCNGPYYKPFREFIFSRTALCHMHLFDSRDKAFKEESVLQENIIIRLERGGEQGDVTVSTSTDDSLHDYVTHSYPFCEIVRPGAPERFIHVPTSPGADALEVSDAARFTLAELDIEVSTGPVVDFRLREFLKDMPAPGAVPLLYPGHFSGSILEWPKLGFKKSNAIVNNAATRKWLYPNGFYTVVRRFSSKEEKRRIVARVVSPEHFPGVAALGFENHLNVFHRNKQGLPEPLTHGLAVYLNSSVVDANFRRFNGHTQVNATDLRAMKFPSRDVLIALGHWAMAQEKLTQAMVDTRVESLLQWVADAPTHLIHFNGVRFLGPYSL